MCCGTGAAIFSASGLKRQDDDLIVIKNGLGRARVPLDWATTQNNLGNALQRLGERESGTVQFDESVLAYREALKERTRERAPLLMGHDQE
jgi:Tetratricopeptide repeat